MDNPIECQRRHARMTELGERVRLWRRDKLLLLGQMASLMGVGSADLSAWETGRKPWPPDMAARVEKTIAFDSETTTQPTPLPREPIVNF